MLKKSRKADLMVEYAAVIGLVVATLAVMQTYMRRGIQGVVQTSADNILGLPSEEYLNAKTADELRNHVRPVMNVSSQWLGAWERGLMNNTGFSTTSASISATNINLTERPPDGVNPVRVTTINTDQTHKTSNSQSVTVDIQRLR